MRPIADKSVIRISYFLDRFSWFLQTRNPEIDPVTFEKFVGH
jgi:hypothetical protein